MQSFNPHHDYISAGKTEDTRVLLEELEYGDGGTCHRLYWAHVSPASDGGLDLKYIGPANPPKSEQRFADEPVAIYPTKED